MVLFYRESFPAGEEAPDSIRGCLFLTLFRDGLNVNEALIQGLTGCERGYG
jgi:hypothetical protein